ncbi:MAG: HAD family hydrolase [Spirochaetaceae bacterium]|nr:MAG: HAD family hydrolase [Spirochaetaceae bacterium]
MAPTLRTVIWDFNGTILSDVELSVEGLNLLRSRRAMHTVTVEEYRDIFGFPVQDYYRCLGFDFEQEDFSLLSREYHDHFFANMHRCRPHRHIPELMHDLRQEGMRQFVLSAMQEPELRRLLDLLGLAECVEAIYGLGDLLARGKVERGHQLMRERKVDPNETVLIGDTDHDVDVARELGVTPITLTMGHQAPHRFDRFDHPRVDSVEELRTLLL